MPRNRVRGLLVGFTSFFALSTGTAASWAGEAVGPDLVTSDMLTSTAFPVVGGERAFSFAMNFCNLGNAPADVQNGTNRHPVFGQALFRISADGAFEQLGVGWLMHDFCALQLTGCDTCVPAGSGCAGGLGAGCMSSHTASILADQSILGPRSEVNAYLGSFLFPHGANGQTGDALFKRMRVALADIDPASNPQATLLGELQLVSRDDALAGNHFNNATSRRYVVSGVNPNLNLFPTGATFDWQPAILLWPLFRSGAQVVDVPVPNEGLFHAGAYVADNGDGTWTYNYAVYNLNSDRAGYSLSVPVGPGVLVTGISFHDVNYHSGEPYTNVDWAGARNSASVDWVADAPFAVNPNANALRWGTAYSFRFTADQPPVPATLQWTLFKPGSPESVAISLPAPAAAVLVGDLNCDGLVSVSDIGPFVLALTDPAAYANAFPMCDGLAGDCSGDGLLTVGDIGCFVQLMNR